VIVESFPGLTDLDLSYNANMTNAVLKVISELGELERLTVIQNRFNDLGTGHLAKLENLRVLDLRGNMEAGDMTMEVVGALPKLSAFKHRSTAVSDFGMELLADSKTLSSLLMQDFGISDAAGPEIAKLENLTQLEVFRCQGLGSQGVLALKGMELSRLKLRDLPMVDNRAMEVLSDLPALTRFELHENDSISDEGLAQLESLKSLEVLDIWAVPQMTDATVDVIAGLPNLRELSIRATGVTDASIDKLLGMSHLKVLTFKDNGGVTAAGLEKLSGKEWSKLDTGS
jgi:Leucine-rich repeat (LRR) protein